MTEIRKSFFITEELDKQVLKFSKENDLSYSQVIRHSLRIILAENPFQYVLEKAKKNEKGKIGEISAQKS